MCGLSCKLLRGQALSAALEEPRLLKLLSRHARLSRELLCGKAELTRLQSAPLCHFLSRKPQGSTLLGSLRGKLLSTEALLSSLN